MADNDTPQHDRTEQPSAKRLEDARKRGEVPRSRELTTTAVVIAGAATLLGGSEFFTNGLEGLFELGLKVPREALFDASLLPRALLEGLVSGIVLVLPIAAATMVAAILSSVALGGWSFSTTALAPNFSRLNPISGLGRVASINGLVELLKALAKFAVVAIVAGLLLWRYGGDFLELGVLSLEAAIARSGWLAGVCLAGLAASLLLVAAADVPFQFWHHRRKLRMTKQELKDELKETEGRPEVRSRIRNLQRAIATRRMMADVPKADLVAVNPTHYAVALRYDAKKMKAPRVVAKGTDLVALQIRRVAEAHKVPVFEHPQFTRALYHTSEIGQEISPRLYVAVAQVLTYVYQLTGRSSVAKRGRIGNPSPPSPKTKTMPPQKPTLDIDPELTVPQRGKPRAGVRA